MLEGNKEKKIHGNKGKIRSEETRRKISISKTGKKVPKISLALKGRKIWNKGLKCPQFAGENSPHWIKDRTQIKQYWTERNNPEYKQWRTKVYERDNFKCKINNDNCKGRIYAHHILGWKQYPELRYEVNNGITLCHYHHPRKREEEARLSPFFSKIISLIK